MTEVAEQHNYFTIYVKHHMEDSLEILDHMRRDRKLCDVTLVVKNEEIPAHKIVLVGYSSFFYSMFSNGKSAEEERIELDVNARALISLVNYMYTLKLTVSKEDIKDVLEITKMLRLQNIQEECCKILNQIRDPNNCLGIRALASTYGNTDLLVSTSCYIDANFVDVVASEEFLILTSDEVTRLISRDTLKTPSEEKVFECVIRWVNHDPEERRKYVRSLMECVRLPLISKSYLKQHIVSHPFLTDDYYIKDLIIDVLLDGDLATARTIRPRKYYESFKALLAVGGVLSEAEKSLEFYDFETKTWSKVFQMPFGVRLAGLAVVKHNVYIVGGERDSIASSALTLYDIITNSWQEVANMSTKRARLGVATLNDCIYAVGGSDGVNVLRSAEKFDLKTQKWTSIASMTTKRRDLRVSVLNNILYAVGGCDGKNILDSIECYNPQTDTWKSLCSMQQCRNGVGVCTFDQKIYAIGGWNWGQCLTSVEIYNPDTDSWIEGTPMNIPRASAGVVVVGERIYVVGGQNNVGLTSGEVYHKLANSWTKLPDSMNVVRTGHTVVVVDMPTSIY